MDTIEYRGDRASGVFWRKKGESKWRPLPPRIDICDHSPNGFNWGYGGSGPAQLALALLAHHFAHHPPPEGTPEEAAQRRYQGFKWRVVARLDFKEWTLTSDDIETALAEDEAGT